VNTDESNELIEIFMFDGDGMTAVAVRDNMLDYVESRIGASARFYSESNLQPLYTPSHEFLLGLNLGTKIDESQPTYEILDSDHLSELISSNQVDYNTPIVFNGEKTCYLICYFSSNFIK
jgi:hypothetical protein